jgi:hypothetical protein
MDAFLLTFNFMFQHKGSHDGGGFLLEMHVVHLQIDISDPVSAPATQDAQQAPSGRRKPIQKNSEAS